MCECYKIGGRFIAEDPDCPVHGYQAEAVRKSNRRIIAQVLDDLERLKEQYPDAGIDSTISLIHRIDYE